MSTDTELTEAEREKLTCDCDESSRSVDFCPLHAGMDHLSPDLSAVYLVRTVECIIAARTRAAVESALESVVALAEEWRYKGEFGWGAWQEGHGPDQEGLILDVASSELRSAIAKTNGTPA